MRVSVVIAGLLAAGCGGSSRVAPEERAVEPEAIELDWRPARASDIDGLFESTRIEGEAAASLWRLAYWFAPDGTYTGSALVFDGERAAFRTLSGQWSLSKGELDFHAGPPAKAEVAGDLLRLDGAAGVAILKRVVIE